MKINPAIAESRSAPPQGSLPAILLLVVVWLIQILYPPLSYPAAGLCLLTILVAAAAILPVHGLIHGNDEGFARLRHWALLPGFAFIVWVIIRWCAAGWPFSGASDVGTFLWASAYFIFAVCLTPARQNLKTPSSKPRHHGITFWIILTFALTGLACGLHAVWQYNYGYAQAYREVLASIAGGAPDRTQLGLLYHLKLRRVAGIWGDPNTLAVFSAISICASLEILTFSGKAKSLYRTVAACAILACLAAIYFSGSRGGALEAAGALALFGGWLLYSSRRPFFKSFAAIMIAVAALTQFISPPQSVAQTTSTEAASQVKPKRVWVWRSDTIRERFYYLEVGARMIEMAPIAGLGPGSVELYFGRLKSPNARESKYLHNWIAQIWAEEGLVGLGLMFMFLGTIGWGMYKSRIWNKPGDRALAMIFLILVCDGLIQVNWNQREIFCTFGLVCGILTGRTGQPAQDRILSTGRRWFRLATCLTIVLLLAYFETRFLTAASSKQIAKDAMYAGDLPVAIEHWEKASQWTPTDPEPFAARASIAEQTHNLSAAGMLIKKALQANPESAALHAQAADIAKKSGQGNKSDTYLTKALQFYPTKSEYLFQYAKNMESEKRYGEALKFAKLALKYSFNKSETKSYEVLVEELHTKGNAINNASE